MTSRASKEHQQAGISLMYPMRSYKEIMLC